MAHDRSVYPAELPHDAISRVIAIFTGSPVVKDDVHLLYDVVGFALGQWDTHPLVMSRGAGFATKSEAADALKKAFPPEGGTRAAAADPKGFNWLALLPFVLQILEAFFKK